MSWRINGFTRFHSDPCKPDCAYYPVNNNLVASLGSWEIPNYFKKLKQNVCLKSRSSWLFMATCWFTRVESKYLCNLNCFCRDNSAIGELSKSSILIIFNTMPSNPEILSLLYVNNCCEEFFSLENSASGELFLYWIERIIYSWS